MLLSLYFSVLSQGGVGLCYHDGQQQPRGRTSGGHDKCACGFGLLSLDGQPDVHLAFFHPAVLHSRVENSPGHCLSGKPGNSDQSWRCYHAGNSIISMTAASRLACRSLGACVLPAVRKRRGRRRGSDRTQVSDLLFLLFNPPTRCLTTSGCQQRHCLDVQNAW